MKKEDCIFCKITSGEIPSRTLYEDEQFRVILDLGPVAKGHALVIPKEHYANLEEMPEELAADAMKLAKKMAINITKKLHADGFNLLQNNGEAAGQSVKHFHMHVIPRYLEDGRQFLLQPGTATDAELDAVKDTILQ